MLVIKIGGSVVDGLHESTILDLKDVSGHDQVILVHGGGKEVTRIAEKLGKEQKFVVSPGGIRSRMANWIGSTWWMRPSPSTTSRTSR